MYNFLFSNMIHINANWNETSETLHWNERRNTTVFPLLIEMRM